MGKKKCQPIVIPLFCFLFLQQAVAAAAAFRARLLCHTFLLQRITWRLAFGYVDDTVDIERNLLARGGPLLVAEAVDVLAVVGSIE